MQKDVLYSLCLKKKKLRLLNVVLFSCHYYIKKVNLNTKRYSGNCLEQNIKKLLRFIIILFLSDNLKLCQIILPSF